VLSVYKEVFGSIKSVAVENGVVFVDASLPGYELGSRAIESSRVSGVGSCKILAGKELG
jgi:hypothetical protein